MKNLRKIGYQNDQHTHTPTHKHTHTYIFAFRGKLCNNEFDDIRESLMSCK